MKTIQDYIIKESSGDVYDFNFNTLNDKLKEAPKNVLDAYNTIVEYLMSLDKKFNIGSVKGDMVEPVTDLLKYVSAKLQTKMKVTTYSYSITEEGFAFLEIKNEKPLKNDNTLELMIFCKDSSNQKTSTTISLSLKNRNDKDIKDWTFQTKYMDLKEAIKSNKLDELLNSPEVSEMVNKYLH